MADQIERRAADAIDNGMAQSMLRRRGERPERRQKSTAPRVDRRKICQYCFQPGDHATPVACLRALERA